ncbi:12759_t:CDS:10, partial [Racocetra persica]
MSCTQGKSQLQDYGNIAQGPFDSERLYDCLSPVTNDTPQTAIVSNILSEKIVDKEYDNINRIQIASKGDKCGKIKIPLPWKYSKERLAKHPYCIYIVQIKKVICRCDKVIKLGHRYNEPFLNIHVNGKGYLAKQGVRSILNYFKLISKSKKIKSDDCVSSAEEWKSDDDKNMDNDDLFKIDEISDIENDCESEVLKYERFTNQNINLSLKGNKLLQNQIAKVKPSTLKLKYTPKYYFENDPLKNYLKYSDLTEIWLIIKDNESNTASDVWIKLAEKGIQGTFNKKPVFKDLTWFKRFLDSIRYDGPIVAMTDNTKLKPYLRYSSRMGCIIGFTFSNHKTNIKTYDDISVTINKIKENNAIAKYVRVYILQVPLPKFPSVIIALLSNLGSDKTETILDIHKLLLDFVQELKLHIISISSDSAQVEFNAQTQFQQISTPSRLRISYNLYNIDFSSISGARVLTLNHTTVGFGYFTKLLTHPETRKYPEFISANQNFIAPQIFAILISLAESMVLLVKAYKDFYNQYPLVSWIYGSEVCEHFFGAAQQVNADFDFAKLLEMVPKIDHYTKALNSKEISFNKDKSVRKACNLAKYLGILILDIISINSLRLYVLITSNDIEVSGSNDENIQDDKNLNENISNYNYSQIISCAAKEIDLLKQKENERDKIDINEENENLDKYKKQLSFINMVEIETSNNTISTGFDNVIFATKNRINFQEMIYQHEKHNAYTFRNIEQTAKTNNTRIINLTSINPNKTSYIVLLFTKNANAKMRFIKQREKRWKNDQKVISQSIANLYKKKQLNKQQKTLFIKNTNINHNNPLNKQDYVIAYYRIQLCIGQVISSFYEAYRYHSYNQEPITNIENISYLTLKVFTPIHNIFLAEIEEDHVLIIYQYPKNILYCLDIQDIQNFDNTFQLLEKAK